MRRFLIISGIGYVVMAVALLGGLFAARNAANRNFSTVEAQRDWDVWRKDASHQDASQPVERSAPRSQEPPTLVLLRDHFPICAAASVTLTSVLYWTTVLFIRGILAGPKFPVEYQSSVDNQRP